MAHVVAMATIACLNILCLSLSKKRLAHSLMVKRIFYHAESLVVELIELEEILEALTHDVHLFRYFGVFGRAQLLHRSFHVDDLSFESRNFLSEVLLRFLNGAWRY